MFKIRGIDIQRNVDELARLTTCYHGKLTRDFERHPRGVLSDGRNKLFDGVLFEKDARMGEEDVEDAMTDFHGGREDDGDVFQAHLVDFFVFDHVDHVDDGPRQE